MSYTESLNMQSANYLAVCTHDDRRQVASVRTVGMNVLRAIEAGAQLLSSGGGGDTHLPRMLVEDAIRRFGPVQLLSSDSLAPSTPVCCTGLVGSVVSFGEKPAGAEVFEQAIQSLCRYKGSQVAAVFPYECAGANAFLTLAHASVQRLPVLDLDFMGRAFHSLTQTTPTLHRLDLAPAVVTSTDGTVVLLDKVDNRGLENFIRPMMRKLGGWGALAAFHEPHEIANKTAISGSYSRAWGLGKLYIENLENNGFDLRKTLAELHEQSVLRSLGSGYVVDVHWTTRSQSGRRSPAAIFTVFMESGNDGVIVSGEHLRLDAMHEFLLVSQNGQVIAQAPEIISVIDVRTQKALQTSSLKQGMEVEIISLPPAPDWASAAGRSLSDPSYHGINLPADK